MTGIFDLTEPRHLLAKMERELDRMRAAPLDVDHAFNFFVTVEPMLDWLHPGTAGRTQREQLRASDPLLEVVSHLATGAKHFDFLSPHHTAVSSTKKEPASGFGMRPFGVGVFGGGPALVVKLSGNVALQLGTQASPLDLARMVLDYWSVPGRLPG
jgi:hypothetical protein